LTNVPWGNLHDKSDIPLSEDEWKLFAKSCAEILSDDGSVLIEVSKNVSFQWMIQQAMKTAVRIVYLCHFYLKGFTMYMFTWEIGYANRTKFFEQSRIVDSPPPSGYYDIRCFFKTGHRTFHQRKLSEMITGVPLFTDNRISWVRMKGEKVYVDGNKDVPYRKQQNSIASMVPLILEYTEPGDVVIDPFDGVGSISISSSALGRIGLGIDNDQSMKLGHGALAGAVHTVCALFFLYSFIC
jgi:DNA methylase.